ncbi:MAG: hypothetical protein QE263_09530 [Vampirovibrionales bacterium]|nr:hypothetical protein [Vampirovibrionales bacterium]
MATPHKRQFSALLVQDVMDTLFARRANSELFSAADEKALSNAMRRGGTRTAAVRAAVVSVPVVQTQRVPPQLPAAQSVENSGATPPQSAWLLELKQSSIAAVISLQAAVFGGVQSVQGFVTSIVEAICFEQQRCQQWLQAGLRKRTLLAKKDQKKKQRLQAQRAALAQQQALLMQHQAEEAATLRAATETIPTTPRESIPMAATVTTPPESYALMALPTVQQRPDLQVFINEALPITVPTAVAGVESSYLPEVFPVRPVVTPLVSDAAVRTLMAHHPQPESLAPHSETDRLLHHNRFLATSINNLAERYFSLQHPPQAGV